MSRKVIYNAIKTPDGTILNSRNRHDCKTHIDANGKTYMIDGGLDYSRRSANGDEIDMCLYDNEIHSVQSDILKWGSYGVSGDEPLKLIKIKDMETSHIEAVLRECYPATVYKNCMKKELNARLEKENKE